MCKTCIKLSNMYNIDCISIFNQDCVQRTVHKRFCVCVYTNVFATDYIIYLAFPFRLARLASSPHRWLGIFSESGPTWISVSCSISAAVRPMTLYYEASMISAPAR